MVSPPIHSPPLISFLDRWPALNRKVSSDRNRRPSRLTPDCDPLIPSQLSICFAIRRPSHTLAIPLIHSLPSIWSSDQWPALNCKGLNRKVSIAYCCVTSPIAILRLNLGHPFPAYPTVLIPSDRKSYRHLKTLRFTFCR